MAHKTEDEEREANMSTESKREKVDLTLVETADMTMVLKAFVEQNDRLLDLVESVLNRQGLDKTLEWQHQQAREKRQDEIADFLKALLPTLLEWVKPAPTPQPPPWVAETKPAPTVQKKRSPRK